jgi:glycerol uptake facilitator-like aquaporin
VTHPLARPLAAEALGSAFLAATVVGSGIMAERLADGNQALALLGNTLPTAAMLAVLTLVFAPTSGAHFNPAVSLVFALRGRLARVHLLLYTSAQIGGALLGVALAHAMFELPAFTASTTIRAGAAQNLAEVIATFGLVGTILGTLRANGNALPYAVALYITAAYWFTASTSFANPALTIARAATDTFSGIAPAGVPYFVTAEIVGALLASVVFGWLLRPSTVSAPTESRTSTDAA